jgi:hypothetical protein
MGAARQRVAECSALSRNSVLSCKRHQFPPVAPDPAAHSKRLWQSSAYIALTVLTVTSVLLTRGWAQVRAMYGRVGVPQFDGQEPCDNSTDLKDRKLDSGLRRLRRRMTLRSGHVSGG